MAKIKITERTFTKFFAESIQGRNIQVTANSYDCKLGIMGSVGGKALGMDFKLLSPTSDPIWPSEGYGVLFTTYGNGYATKSEILTINASGGLNPVIHAESFTTYFKNLKNASTTAMQMIDTQENTGGVFRVPHLGLFGRSNWAACPERRAA